MEVLHLCQISGEDTASLYKPGLGQEETCYFVIKKKKKKSHLKRWAWDLHPVNYHAVPILVARLYQENKGAPLVLVCLFSLCLDDTVARC